MAESPLLMVAPMHIVLYTICAQKMKDKTHGGDTAPYDTLRVLQTVQYSTQKYDCNRCKNIKSNIA